jgi:hypothetical protein
MVRKASGGKVIVEIQHMRKDRNETKLTGGSISEIGARFVLRFVGRALRLLDNVERSRKFWSMNQLRNCCMQYVDTRQKKCEGYDNKVEFDADRGKRGECKLY